MVVTIVLLPLTAVVQNPIGINSIRCFRYSLIRPEKMTIIIKTPVVPRTKLQKRRLRLLENSLDKIKLKASVRDDDLDRVVDHVVRVNNMIQKCIWHGSFQLGKDEKAAYDKLVNSFKNKFLKAFVAQSWHEAGGSYHRALRLFFTMFIELGVQRTKDREDVMRLRSGRCVARVIEGEIIWHFPSDLESKINMSLPIRKKMYLN